MKSVQPFTLCALFVLVFAATPGHTQQKRLAYKPIDKATIAAYEKIGMVFVVQHSGKPPTLCFSGALAKRKIDFSKKFPKVNVLFGLYINECAPMTDANMKNLAQLENLTFLHLSNTKVTSEGLKHLAKLKKLKRLELENKKIDDAALKVLRKIGLLHTLVGANFNPVDTERRDDRDYWDSAEDVKRFALLTTSITDAGVKELAVFKNLEHLNLANTRVTGTGLKHMTGLKKLRSLTLSKVTDEGLKHVARLANLTSLTIFSVNKKYFKGTDLNEAKITDRGLQELAALGKLSELNLRFCPHVTKKSVDALRRALPRCKIIVER